MAEESKKTDSWSIASWASTIVLSGIWFYIQLQVWKQEGKDHMLTAANMAVTILLWLSLGWAVYRAHKRSRHADELLEKAYDWAQDAKRAGGQASLLFHLAACAGDLRERLERVEFNWRRAGDVLVYPLDASRNKYKEWGDHVNEHRDFMSIYTQHRVRLSVDFPGFTSRMLAHGYPSDCEYPVFLSDLRDHIDSLNTLGARAWKDEEEIKSLHVKEG